MTNWLEDELKNSGKQSPAQPAVATKDKAAGKGTGGYADAGDEKSQEERLAALEEKVTALEAAQTATDAALGTVA